MYAIPSTLCCHWCRNRGIDFWRVNVRAIWWNWGSREVHFIFTWDGIGGLLVRNPQKKSQVAIGAIAWLWYIPRFKYDC